MSPATFILLCAASTCQLGEILEQDFRRGKALHPGLELFGPRSSGTIRYDSSGMRIILREGRKRPEPVGVGTVFQVSGDFEITLSYEILSTGKPKSGFGAGVNIWCRIGETNPKAVILGRFKTPNNQDMFITQIADRNPKEEEKKTIQERFEATNQKGKLRLSRKGSILSFLVSDAKGDNFRELKQGEVGTEDLRLMRISANTSNSPTALILRLNDLAFRADKLSIEGTNPEETGSLLLWLISLITIVGAIIFIVRRRFRER